MHIIFCSHIDTVFSIYYKIPIVFPKKITFFFKYWMKRALREFFYIESSQPPCKRARALAAIGSKKFSLSTAAMKLFKKEELLR